MLRSRGRPTHHAYVSLCRVRRVTVSLLLSALLSQQLDRDDAQTNHIYENEFLAVPRRGGERACATYEAVPASVVLDEDRYPWHPGVRHVSNPETLYGTAYAQHRIWEHQHPPDCADVKFLSMLHWPTGIGALLHFLGRALGLAMHLGRILVVSLEDFDPAQGSPGMPWYDAQFCPGKISWECWFQPLSGCNEMRDSDTMVVQPEHLGRFRAGNFTRHYVPVAFEEMLRDCSGVKPALRFHWWHAQAVTYLVRFNRGTRRLLDDLRVRLLRTRHAGSRSVRVLRSLPHGAIAMHVRRGDKGSEMPLLPLARYLEQADRLASEQPVPVLGPEFSSSGRVFTPAARSYAARQIFVSTEDPAVMNEVLDLAEADMSGERRPWTVAFTRENRTNAAVAAMRSERGNGHATLQAWLSLELSLEAEAWVCTLRSNWCLLIDELRMTVAGKASAPFANIVEEGHRRGEGCPPFQRDCYILWR